MLQTSQPRSVFQDWVCRLTFMQQSVLSEMIRGPDGFRKFHPVKPMMKWFRRCAVISAFDGRPLTNPYESGGGSFTGPSCDPPPINVNDSVQYWQDQMDHVWDLFMAEMDEMPIHFWLHLMHAIEIMGYKHSDDVIRSWWQGKYVRMVHSMHVWPETQAELDMRLGDNRANWLERSDPATNDLR